MEITPESRHENLLAASNLKNHLLGKVIRNIIVYIVYKEKSLVRFILSDDSIIDIQTLPDRDANKGLYEWLRICKDGQELLRT